MFINFRAGRQIPLAIEMHIERDYHLSAALSAQEIVCILPSLLAVLHQDIEFLQSMVQSMVQVLHLPRLSRLQ